MDRKEKLTLLRELVSIASSVRDLVRDSEVADASISTYERMSKLIADLRADACQWNGERDEVAA